MNKMILFLGMVLLITLPANISADTMTIYASAGNLDAIIGADTLAGGAQAHDTYQLVSLDTTYKFAGTITVKGDITVTGVVDATTLRPPTCLLYTSDAADE